MDIINKPLSGLLNGPIMHLRLEPGLPQLFNWDVHVIVFVEGLLALFRAWIIFQLLFQELAKQKQCIKLDCKCSNKHNVGENP